MTTPIFSGKINMKGWELGEKTQEKIIKRITKAAEKLTTWLLAEENDQRFVTFARCFRTKMVSPLEIDILFSEQKNSPRLSFDLSTVIDDLIESYMHGNDDKVISAVLKQLKKKVTELETVIEKNKT